MVARIEAAPPRRPTKTNTEVVQARRLDRRLSQDIIIELVDAYRGGASTNRLCQLYGLSKGGLLKILREHGVVMRYQPMTEAEIGWAVRLYSEGQSLNSIARKLGKGKGSVWKALRSSGIQLRS